MSTNLELIEVLLKTRLGTRMKAVVLKKGGKVLAKRWKRLARQAATRVGLRADSVLLVVGALAQRAAELLPKYQRQYSFLATFSPRAFADAVATVAVLDRRSYRALRGIIVERYVPDMREMGALLSNLANYARRSDRKWSTPTLISGVRTPDGREIADWMVLCTHPDGRIWVMALIESKSISNTADLVSHRGTGLGQHLWDILRAKSQGLQIERVDAQGNLTQTVVLPSKLVLQPRPLQGSTSSGLYTDLIGVTPRAFSNGELRKLSSQCVSIERWPWPVDEDEMLRFLRDLGNELRVEGSASTP